MKQTKNDNSEVADVISTSLETTEASESARRARLEKEVQDKSLAALLEKTKQERDTVESKNSK